MTNWFKPLYLILAISSVSVQASDHGGITVGGTRLIYPGGQKEASLSINNSDTRPYLIQSWAETSSPSSEKVPFMVTPPLFRLDSNQQNLLRIVRTGDGLPSDRESLYWMNIKSIPANSQTDGANTLQIAVKTRIKLIYRPQELSGTPEDVTHKLTWSKSGTSLMVNNPTSFIMNFQQVKIGNREVKNISYVLPMSQATFTVPNDAEGPVTWSLINDYGGTGATHSSVN